MKRLRLLPVLAWSLAAAGGHAAEPLDEWRWRNPSPLGLLGLSSVTYGDGKFVVACSSNPVVAISADGAAWITAHIANTNQINSVIYDGGKFVAVGDHGTVLTSDHGFIWTKRDSGTSSQLWGVAHGDDMFVAVGNAAILTSTDGIAWNLQPGISGTLYSVAYGGGKFVAVGFQTLLTSADGVNWERPASGSVHNFISITYGGGQFVSAALGGGIFSSLDADKWTGSTFGPLTAWRSIKHVKGLFVTAGRAGLLAVSSDAITWTTKYTETSETFNACAGGNGVFVAVGSAGTIATSNDGTNWTLRSQSVTSARLNAVANHDGTFVAVGQRGTILGSADGILWTTRSSGTSSNLFGVGFGGGKYIAVGEAILSSLEGAAWVPSNYRVSSNTLQSVAYGNSTYAAVGANGTIITSPDGLTWTRVGSGTSGPLTGVAFGPGRFVAVGRGGVMLTSSDGVSWVTGPPGADFPDGIGYTDGLFVIYSSGGGLLSSPDGTTWTRRAGTVGVRSHSEGVFLGVYRGWIFTSTDGASWVARYPIRPGQLGPGKAVFGPRTDTFVVVGDQGGILQSGWVHPPRLVIDGRGRDGAIELTIVGHSGVEYRLQASSNLGSPEWTDLLRFANIQESTLYLDADAINFGRRFYRVLPP